MPNPDRTVFAVALLENDNADPLQVTNQTRTLLQGTLTQTWINASNRTDLDESARFEFYASSARTAFESAIDTARGFSPPGAVLGVGHLVAGAAQAVVATSRFAPIQNTSS